MTKAELIERIIDRITDPWTESCEDYADAELIDLATAAELLAQCVKEDEVDLEPEERLPAEVTPALMMEAYNCNVRMNKFDLRVKRLAEYIEKYECVCEYVNCYVPAHPDALDIHPVDCLWEHFPFKMIDDEYPNPLWLIQLGQRSPYFNANHEFCWYDRDKNQLFSSDSPFSEGILDAEEVARYILLDTDSLGEFLNYLDEDEIKYIFG